VRNIVCQEKWIFLIILSLILFGCAKSTHPVRKLTYKEASTYRFIKLPEEKKIKIPSSLLEPIFLLPSQKISEAEVLKEKVSLSVTNQKLIEIFKLLSRVTGVDIIWDEDVERENPEVSFTFENKSLKEVLDIICNRFDYYYIVKHNTVYVKVYQTRYYDIGIPKIEVTSNVNINGNIFSGGGGGGGVSTSSSTGSGGVNYSVKGLENKNPYDRLKEMLNKIRSPKGHYFIDEDTGYLVITERVSVLNKVDEIVKWFKYFYSKQVEVEVAIMEVDYNKNEECAIDWTSILSKLSKKLQLSVRSTNTPTPGMSGFVLSGNEVRVGDIAQVQNMIINFLKNYGTTKIISSPRLRLTNGYSALVVAGVWKPYFKKTESAGSNGTVAVNWEETTYLQGALLNVTVKINNENDIYLQVVPMITDIIGEVTTQDASITSPVTMMRQATTILKLHNNDIAILAGLKGKKLIKNRSGIPYLMNIKGLNFLTGGKDYTLTTTEIVMVIHVKLLY